MLATVRNKVGLRLRGAEASRRRLLRLLPKRAVGAEVGVWKGDFSSELLAKTHPRRLHLIDPWQVRDDYDSPLYGTDSDPREIEAIYERVVERFEGDPVVIHRKPSVEVYIPGLSWAYIDGDHTYDGVSADLAHYGAMLSPGGILSGDDYGCRGWWGDSVTEAVDEFRAVEGWKVELMSGGQYALRKPAPTS